MIKSLRLFYSNLPKKTEIGNPSINDFSVVLT